MTKFNNLKLISFVGVDNKTDLNELNKMQEAQCAALEFSVLFSRGRKGGRYSTYEFCKEFLSINTSYRKSLHLCGKPAIDEFLEGNEDILALCNLANRIQLNFSIKKHDEAQLVQGITNAINKGNNLILQLNKSKSVFTHTVMNLRLDKEKLSILYDGSGGFGREIQFIVPPFKDHFTGYAGGLNPSNVQRIVEMIEEKNTENLPYYIDMESGVREDNIFSVSKYAEVIKELS